MTRKQEIEQQMRDKEHEIDLLRAKIAALPKPMYISAPGIGDFNDRALVVNIDENTGTPSEVVIQFPNSWGLRDQVTYQKQ